jgi:hypothetical protein
LLMDLFEENNLTQKPVARNFIKDWGGISIDPSARLGSSSIQSTQNAEEFQSVETRVWRIQCKFNANGHGLSNVNDLGQDCQGLWHC